MKVYVSRHRMFDATKGWNLTNTQEVNIEINETLLHSLAGGWYQEDFYVQLSTYDVNALRKLKRMAKVGGNVYFGFWLEGNRLFQVQMMFQEGSRRKKNEIPASLMYLINGFPEIFPKPFPLLNEEGLCS